MEYDKICKIWCEFVRNTLLPPSITSKLEEVVYDSKGVAYIRKEDFRLIARILRYRKSYYGEGDIWKLVNNGAFDNYKYKEWVELQDDLLATLEKTGNKKAHTASRNGVIIAAMKDFIASFDIDANVRDEYKQKIADIEQINQAENIANNITNEDANSMQTNTKNIVNIDKPGEEKMRIIYNQIKPGTKGLTAAEVNKISKASIYKGMNFGKRVIMMGRNYNDFENNLDGDIIYFEGHNVRKNETDKNPFYVDQPRYLENAKFCDAVDAYKKGAEPAYINVFHNLGPNNWEYKGIYALVDYKYINSQGRMVYRFELKKYGS